MKSTNQIKLYNVDSIIKMEYWKMQMDKPYLNSLYYMNNGN